MLISESNLHDADWSKINAVFSSFPQIEKAWLYGSRAKGTSKPYSDIDITLEGDNLNLAVLNEVEIALDDLLLPYEFDLSIKKGIKNEDLLNHIDRVGKVVYARKGENSFDVSGH
ncbi:MAG TPA: nucleotidyltransferase domain-containing protein [Flavipsychrobacter sp.]|nr:nucleotidyltransferase domain-containing protein [Flavipsychrobacter sp.]